jgi:hypothetical protein
MSVAAIVTVLGPAFGLAGHLLDLPLLFWVGVAVCGITLSLNVLSGVLRLPILPGVCMLAGTFGDWPWYRGVALGLVAWSFFEAAGEVTGYLRSRRLNPGA